MIDVSYFNCGLLLVVAFVLMLVMPYVVEYRSQGSWAFMGQMILGSVLLFALILSLAAACYMAYELVLTKIVIVG